MVAGWDDPTDMHGCAAPAAVSSARRDGRAPARRRVHHSRPWARARREPRAEPRLRGGRLRAPRVLRRRAPVRGRGRRVGDSVGITSGTDAPWYSRTCGGLSEDTVGSGGEPASSADELSARADTPSGCGAAGRRVCDWVRCPPDLFDDAENAADSVRACGAGELCALGVAVAGALRSDALDALCRSESALFTSGSPLARGVRARTDPPLVDPDASEDRDELADGSPSRGARMPDAGAAGERARILDAASAGESARLAADSLLPARGRVIVACSEAPFPSRSRVPARSRAPACGARAGSQREGRASRPRAEPESSTGLSSGTPSIWRTLADSRNAIALTETALAIETLHAVESVE
jgi:hypothetical protein